MSSVKDSRAATIRLMREWVRCILQEQPSQKLRRKPSMTSFRRDIIANAANTLFDATDSSPTDGMGVRIKLKDKDKKLTPKEEHDSIVGLVSATYPDSELIEVAPPGRVGNSRSKKFNTYVFKVPWGDPAQGKFEQFGVLLGSGGNLGQRFEDDLSIALKELASTDPASLLVPTPQQKILLQKLGLYELDAQGNIIKDNLSGAKVIQTKPQKRPLSPKPTDVAKKIADIVITPKEGSPVYISVKNVAGDTFGNFGYTGGFIVTKTKSKKRPYSVAVGTGPKEAEKLVAALGINKKKAAQGFENYFNETKKFKRKIVRPRNVDKEAVLGFLSSGIGYGYWYVRESKGSFETKHIASAKDAEEMVGQIKDIKVTYPQSGASKAIVAYVTTDKYRFDVAIRDSSGKPASPPSEIKMSLRPLKK